MLKLVIAISLPESVVIATVIEETLRVRPESASPSLNIRKPSLMPIKFNLTGCSKRYSELNSRHLTLAMFITFALI